MASRAVGLGVFLVLEIVALRWVLTRIIDP